MNYTKEDINNMKRKICCKCHQQTLVQKNEEEAYVCSSIICGYKIKYIDVIKEMDRLNMPQDQKHVFSSALASSSSSSSLILDENVEHKLFDDLPEHVGLYKPVLLIKEEKARPQDISAFKILDNVNEYLHNFDKIASCICIQCMHKCETIRISHLKKPKNNIKCTNPVCGVYYVLTDSFSYDIGLFKVKGREYIEKKISESEIQDLIYTNLCPSCITDLTDNMPEEMVMSKKRVRTCNNPECGLVFVPDDNFRWKLKI